MKSPLSMSAGRGVRSFQPLISYLEIEESRLWPVARPLLGLLEPGVEVEQLGALQLADHGGQEGGRRLEGGFQLQLRRLLEHLLHHGRGHRERLEGGG